MPGSSAAWSQVSMMPLGIMAHVHAGTGSPERLAATTAQSAAALRACLSSSHCSAEHMRLRVFPVPAPDCEASQL